MTTPADRTEAVARLIDPAAFADDDWTMVGFSDAARRLVAQAAQRKATARARAGAVLAYLDAQEPTP